MSIVALNWAFSLKLPPTAKFVLVALADRADENGHCWPGTRDIQRRTCLSARRVLGALDALAAAGVISTERGGPRRPNHYTLAVGAMTTVANPDTRNAALPTSERCAPYGGSRTLTEPPTNRHSTVQENSRASQKRDARHTMAPQPNGASDEWPTQTMRGWAIQRRLDPDYATEILLSNEFVPEHPVDRKKLTDRWYALTTANGEGYEGRVLDHLSDHLEVYE